MKLLLLILPISALLFAQEPWFTGPLIAPNGTVTPYGEFEIQAYVFCTTDVGSYSSHWKSVSDSHNFFSLNPQLYWFFGLTPWMDISVVPQFFYNTTAGQSSTRFGDLPVLLDFQLLDQGYTLYFPGIKFTVGETFPTGTFQNLNPNKLLTDQTGAGTFATSFSLVLYDDYHLGGNHYISTTYSAEYTVTTPVKVHGFNAYGGSDKTDGTVLPGNSFEGIVSFELSLNQNWNLAIDNVYTHTDSSKFFGTDGAGIPSSEQISFAPAIEYSFNANLGLIAGCWFTAWGRNSSEFRSGVVALDYTY